MAALECFKVFCLTSSRNLLCPQARNLSCNAIGKVAFASRKQYAVYAFVAVWIGSWHQTNTDDTAHCMKVEHTHSCWKLWKCYRYGTSVLWCDCVESKNFYSRTAILIGWIAHSWKSGNSNDRIPHVHTLTIIIHNSTWSWQRQSVWAIPL